MLIHAQTKLSLCPLVRFYYLNVTPTFHRAQQLKFDLLASNIRVLTARKPFSASGNLSKALTAPPGLSKRVQKRRVANMTLLQHNPPDPTPLAQALKNAVQAASTRAEEGQRIFGPIADL